MPNAEPYGSGEPLVFDTSAWNRQRNPVVFDRWLASLEAERLLACPVVALCRALGIASVWVAEPGAID